MGLVECRRSKVLSGFGFGSHDSAAAQQEDHILCSRGWGKGMKWKSGLFTEFRLMEPSTEGTERKNVKGAKRETSGEQSYDGDKAKSKGPGMSRTGILSLAVHTKRGKFTLSHQHHHLCHYPPGMAPRLPAPLLHFVIAISTLRTTGFETQVRVR